MKQLFFLLAALLPITAQAADLKLVTESYPPFNYREGDTYKGASVEQVRLLMDDAGIGYTMEMMPWARALYLAENHEMHCVFTTVHNKERHGRFKWVEPLLTSRTVLIRKSGSPANPKTIEEAKAFRVGTQRDDYTQTILEENGFPRIDLATDMELTLKKLMTGRVDLMPISEKFYDRLRRDGQPVESTVALAEDVYSLACNPTVPDELIGKMQKSLDKLIANGTQARLFEKYGLAGDHQE
ncbi:MAG TPA: transporter substrate-binding domain-containing protein [Sinorhizobium sp.]|nr:transporter substrate-binding domain-containing protein [Sinorhizobium sp.]